MATDVEVAAAQLLIAVQEAKNEDTEDWLYELAAQKPNGIPAYSIDNKTP